MNRICPTTLLLAFGTAGLVLLAAGCATPNSGPLVPYPPQTQAPQSPQTAPPPNPGSSGGSVQSTEMNEVLDAIAAKSGEQIRAPQGSDPHGSPAQPAGAGTPTGSYPAGTNSSRGTTTAGAQTTPARPLGRDDDIVARQLREAAERETDPAVRDQLWKEYNDYR